MNGEIFLIHPLAVVKWHLAKATLSKNAKAQVNESAYTTRDYSSYMVYCQLQNTLD